jgi:hypothetical protein
MEERRKEERRKYDRRQNKEDAKNFLGMERRLAERRTVTRRRSFSTATAEEVLN